jgi:hypothetical protein
MIECLENNCCQWSGFKDFIQKPIVDLINRIIEYALSTFFYMGHKVMPDAIAKERTQSLIDNQGAHRLACQNHAGKDIDLLYVPSSSPHRTGNAVVLALNTTYQNHPLKHYAHYLKNGADVVLWNQTAKNTAQYAQDLLSVLKTVQEENPMQKLCIKSYCAAVEPSIAALAELNDPRISLIADRGHGDVFRLARSQTIFGRLSCVQKVLREKFSCGGLQKIKDIPGPIAVVAPPIADDQCMHYAYGTRNLTHDLYMARQRDGDALVLYQGGDHWMQWNAAVHDAVNAFLCKNGILAPDYPLSHANMPTPPSFFKRRVMPILIKSPCDC